ncbi:CapA family protein [Nesterenkonia cremea]|uniref:Capsule synthesis protein CapA domain-containing protein n=1 Tax=Nesterenkonia cremea TaxID=1882340 RepID=A0A917ANS7_9MICC|nr:CapA family protein [Nesterenkonia cremea]GGE62726.1 hypothetical protein GCM10011401_07240 [Nesterenkonia cremea]
MTLLCATGDLVLEREDCTELFDEARTALDQADVLVGHLEVPHTEHRQSSSSDVPAAAAAPAALDAVAEAGFDILTLAGNHVADFGGVGISDTRRHCLDRGMAVTGAGEDLEQACEPAEVQTPEGTVRVISVNCVGPPESAAGTQKPGAASVQVITHYEPRGANPGGPPAVYTFAEPASLRSFIQRVSEAYHNGPEAPVLVVALHKGLVHQRAQIADYEYEIAYAALDAGAAAVISHHAHIFKGIEVYRGRPIFHGLGNFVTVTSALTGAETTSAEQRRWTDERQRLFGFVPDPSMPDYPFHPESRHTGIAALEIRAGAVVGAGLILCRIDQQARPVPLTRGRSAEETASYIRQITAEAGLDTALSWDGDRLRIELEGGTA